MDQLTQALDSLESAAASGTGDLLATYNQIRPHLEQLVTALSSQSGDLARIGAVIENLMAGADSISSGAPSAITGATAVGQGAETI
jgi:hypothetical protein